MKQPFLILAILALVYALPASINVLERTEQYILLEYRLDEFQLVEEGDYVRIDAKNMNYTPVSGAPLLPYSELKVGIPPSGNISVSLLSSSTQSQTLKRRLVPVPEVFMENELSAYRYLINEILYSEPAKPLLNKLEPGGYRGYSFIPLEIHPFAYDGGLNLEITQQALIRIDIAGDTGLRSPGESDDLSELILSQLLNPEQSRNWHSMDRTQVNYADFSRSDYWIRLETNRDGMFKLTPAQLSSFPLSEINPRYFRLFSTGGELLPFTVTNPGAEFKEIPIRVEGEADGSFDPGDYIVFYGTNRDGVSKNQSLQNATYYNPYSGNTVYWLTFGDENYPGPPLRMQTLPVLDTWTSQTSNTTDQARLETESQRRNLLGFDWFMTRLFGNSTASYEFQVDLTDLDTTQSQSLSFWIQQEDIGSTLWHNISVSVNNIPVPADTLGNIIFRWRGAGEYIFSKSVSSFGEGSNTIRITVNRGGTDNLFLNWITVDYKRLLNKSSAQYIVNQSALNLNQNIRYNFTGSNSTRIYRINSFSEADIVPLQSTGSGFYFVGAGISGTKYILSSDAELYSPLNISSIVPTDLTANPAAVDNIIITADEYESQSQALAAMYLQDLNKRSIVVKQSDIFNQFNGGHPDPAAIRQFIRHVFFNYPAPRLTSVTLMGLGTSDWRNYSGISTPKNKLMVFQRNENVSDDYYAMLTQSAYPEVAIGRYPVRNTNELNNMLSNFQRYNEAPVGGWWRNSMVFLGDDLFNGSTGSYENVHTRDTENAADRVHRSVLVDKIFAWLYEYDEFQNKPGARDDMMAAINDGRLVWYYIGHGAYDKLGAEDYFNGASDMGRFNNAGKLPLFMAASCSVSHFDYWGYDSLGQKVVLLDNLGAIASFAATRNSDPYANAPMMENLLSSLSIGRNPIGSAIMQAKFQYTGSPENDATYVLLGDPLLRIIPPIRDSLVSIVSDSPFGGEAIHARQLVNLDGQFNPSQVNGIAEFRAYNNETTKTLDWQTTVSQRGSNLYKGSVSVESGAYDAGFIVPDDVSTGNTGLLVSYLWDPSAKQDYVNYRYPLTLNSQAVTAENPDTLRIEIFLGSMDFRPGDVVGTSPTLYAKISDSNGINVTGSAGHDMLLVLDGSLQPIPVTSFFTYDKDSHTTGTLIYPIRNLSEGSHTVQIIAFDNFNLPSVATTHFVVKKSGALSIESFLIYPNPMAQDTYFTFMLSENSDITVDIYTISGKKVHTIQAIGTTGFNKVQWNGKDKRGARLANNTYFVKLRASSGGKKAETTDKLVIYK